MKSLSRDFTKGEKILMAFLALILVGLAYYYVVDRPVRDSLAKAETAKENIQVELTAVNAKIQRMEEMKAELERLQSDPNTSFMGSYNNSKEELTFLNDILSGAEQFSVSFSNVTRDGDQIRRNFKLNFVVPDYDSMESLMKKLGEGRLRCLINDISYNTVRHYYTAAERKDLDTDIEYYDRVTVNATATFFETMVGGTPDAGLPAEKPSQSSSPSS